MITISHLPRDTHELISKHLELNDITSCLKVSKEWSKFFKADSIWKLLAATYEVEKKVRKLEKIQALFSPNDYMSLVRKKVETIEHKIRKRCDGEFRKALSFLFDGNVRLQDLPNLELPAKVRKYEGSSCMSVLLDNHDKLWAHIKDKHFTVPITFVRVDVNCHQTDASLLLLRFKSERNNKTYKVAVRFEDMDVLVVSNEDVIRGKGGAQAYAGGDYFTTGTNVRMKFFSTEVEKKFTKLGVKAEDPSGLKTLKKIIQGKTELKLY